VEADAGGSLAGLDFHRDLAVLVSRAKLDLSELRVTACGSEAEAILPVTRHPDRPTPGTSHADEQFVALPQAARLASDLLERKISEGAITLGSAAMIASNRPAVSCGVRIVAP
jgi:hypothetical protein